MGAGRDDEGAAICNHAFTAENRVLEERRSRGVPGDLVQPAQAQTVKFGADLSVGSDVHAELPS